jgi:enoyl-CoA hydratase/carnithine racemase
LKKTDHLKDPRTPLYFETKAGVTTLYFNQPEKLNPFDFALSKRFADAIDAIKKEPSHVVVITGKGRAFSAGADLAFLEQCTLQTEARTRSQLKQLYSHFLRVRELPQVSIAKVNGAVAGGGLGIVWACDLRVVLSSAKFAFNFVKLGISPGMGILHMTSQILGQSKAKEVWLRGLTCSGAEIVEWGGAVGKADTIEALDGLCVTLSEEILGNGKLGMEFIKKEFEWSDSIQKHVDFNCRHQAKCLKSEEALEGLRAMREKRAPRFSPTV